MFLFVHGSIHVDLETTADKKVNDDDDGDGGIFTFTVLKNVKFLLIDAQLCQI